MPNMPESAAEGLLCNADGQLLEGLVTNLFVVAGTGCSVEQCNFDFCMIVQLLWVRSTAVCRSSCWSCWLCCNLQRCTHVLSLERHCTAVRR